MIEFIDKTSQKDGTHINRKSMMAIQGFISSKTEIMENGDIVETNSEGHTLTTRINQNGEILEIFRGEKTITKITKFNPDGSIEEVIS
jgi:hypothetical protein